MHRWHQLGERTLGPSRRPHHLIWLVLSTMLLLSLSGGAAQPLDSLPCARRSTRPEGGLQSCTLARAAEVNGQPFPAETRLEFSPEGNLDCCYLPRDTHIQGLLCRGGGHHFQTCFHPNGRLRFLNLARPETIQGIPCQKSTFWKWLFQGKAGVEFYDNGKLKNCLLAADTVVEGMLLPKNHRVQFDRQGNRVTVRHPAP